MRTLILILALASVAEAAPAYPVRISTVSQSERDRRKAAFVAREPIHWTQIRLNGRGLVVHLATEDPALPVTQSGVDLGPVRELLRREAAAFGIDPADLAGEFRNLGTCSSQLYHERKLAFLGRIDVSCEPTGDHFTVTIDVVPWLDVTPKLGPDDVSGRVLGSHYAITSTEVIGGGMLDCNMVVGGGSCPKPHTVTRHDVVEMQVTDLGDMEAKIYRQGNTLRLVYCVDAPWNAPERGYRVRPLGDARRLPYAVDAVTGTELRLAPGACKTLPSVAWID